jgi:hypothetical protein
MSCNSGKRTEDLSDDHKPTSDVEIKRISKGGGKIY